MAENQISETTRNSFLDSYGFAQLATESPRLEIEGMRTMYGALLDGGDSFIDNAVNMAGMAKEHLQKKTTYLALKGQYDAAPKETRGKFELEDPGKLDQNLANSLQALREATKTYTSKREGMIVEMSASEMLKYNSSSDGKSIIAMPENVKTMLQNSTTPLKNIKNKQKQGMLYTAIKTTDDYKIHGILNEQVEREVATRGLAMLSKGLEAKVK